MILINSEITLYEGTKLSLISNPKPNPNPVPNLTPDQIRI